MQGDFDLDLLKDGLVAASLMVSTARGLLFLESSSSMAAAFEHLPQFREQLRHSQTSCTSFAPLPCTPPACLPAVRPDAVGPSVRRRQQTRQRTAHDWRGPSVLDRRCRRYGPRAQLPSAPSGQGAGGRWQRPVRCSGSAAHRRLRAPPTEELVASCPLHLLPRGVCAGEWVMSLFFSSPQALAISCAAV